MKCYYCRRMIPDDSVFCCFCGGCINKHVSISAPTSHSLSYRIDTYYWEEYMDSEDLKSRWGRGGGYCEDEIVNLRDKYLVKRCSCSSTRYQTIQLMQYDQTDRIILSFKLHSLEEDRVFVAINFDWLEKELSVYDSKKLAGVLDYTIEYHKDGLEWILAKFQGSDMRWSKDLFEKNNFVTVFKEVSSRFFTPTNNGLSELYSQAGNGLLSYVNNGPRISDISFMREIPGDLKYKVVQIKNNGILFSCPMINGHGFTAFFRNILYEQYGVNSLFDDIIPGHFFKKYELIEIINSDLTFMVNNLFRDEYKSWEAPDGDDYDSQVVQWYTIKLIE